MKARRTTVITILAMVALGAVGALWIKWCGFRASSTPSAIEAGIARSLRNFAIPGDERKRTNPLANDDVALEQGREQFMAQCATCHGVDGHGSTVIGTNEYPRVPDLHSDLTQRMSDGEIHYIIQNGVQLTGMPAMRGIHSETDSESWKLVSFIRSFRSSTYQDAAHQRSVMGSAHYVGSESCAKCHAELYERWKKTPMANVVRDPREHPDAIIPDLNTNNVAKFTVDQVAFVYGSRWKQRYFTKIGNDYYHYQCNGTSVIKNGRSTTYPTRARIGGQLTTPLTICSVRPGLPVMAVTP